MKFISYSFQQGGAAIAAKRFVELAEKVLNREVELISVKQGLTFHFLKRVMAFLLVKLQNDRNPIKHSLNLFSYKPLLNEFRQNQHTLHHIHWINNDTLSIFDFDKIPSGSIITLHDEWLYCGTEHVYKVDDDSLDFINGYSLNKRNILGINWNFIIWKIKYKKLSSRQDIIFTVPSKWMLNRASKSLILKHSNIKLLPNPIDTSIFKPLHKEHQLHYRKLIGISDESIVITFAIFKGKNNTLKGNSQLISALQEWKRTLSEKESERITLIVFGGNKKQSSMLCGFRCVEIGRINEQAELALVYSTSSCVVVPSLVESFGQVAAEAASCGIPVVCFDTSGLRDIVIDNVTGFVAERFKPKSLMNKLQCAISMSDSEQQKMQSNAREHILTHFSYSIVAQKYAEIISDAEKIKALNTK